MCAARCRVSFTDSDGIAHTAYVLAESLYEAVGLAVAEFRQDRPVPSAHTDDGIHDLPLHARPSSIGIRLSQVEKWAQAPTTTAQPRTRMAASPIARLKDRASPANRYRCP